jgi:hypothetical protein
MTAAGFFVVILNEGCRSEGSTRSDSFVLFDNPIVLAIIRQLTESIMKATVS